jgi:NAD(P)-dependent dehydrogenase (short-subunit alcohol dehydrogenase family)
MGQVDNKVALVTGGTSGVGRATAQRFADEGAYVFVTGRRQAELDATVKTLGDRGRGVRADVSRAEDLDDLYAQVRGHGGGLDVLFATRAAGPSRPWPTSPRRTSTRRSRSTWAARGFVTGSELFVDGGEEQQ